MYNILLCIHNIMFIISDIYVESIHRVNSLIFRWTEVSST